MRAWKIQLEQNLMQMLWIFLLKQSKKISTWAERLYILKICSFKRIIKVFVVKFESFKNLMHYMMPYITFRLTTISALL